MMAADSKFDLMRRSIPKLRTRATQDPRPEVEDVFTFWYCSCIFCCAIGYFCITVDEIVDYASPIVAVVECCVAVGNKLKFPRV